MAATKSPETGLQMFDQFTALSGDVTQLRDVLAENLAGEQLAVTDLPRILIPSGGGTSWEVPTPKGPQPMRTIEALIVYTSRQRAYWASAVAVAGTPPQCISSDCITGVGDPGGDCLTCPLNEWESKIGPDGNPSRGKACKETRLLYLLLPGALLPAALRVPATSLRATREYLLSLATVGLPYHKVVTRISLTKEQNAGGQPYSKIAFGMGERMDDATHARMLELVAFYRGSLQRIQARDAATTYGPSDEI